MGRDSSTAVEVADRTDAKISVLLCKTPCCLVDETGASIWTSSVVALTAVGFMTAVYKECRRRTLFLYRRGSRTCYCSVACVQSHSLPDLLEMLVTGHQWGGAGVCVNERGKFHLTRCHLPLNKPSDTHIVSQLVPRTTRFALTGTSAPPKPCIFT